MTPPMVGAKAILNPISPMKNNANPVIIRVLVAALLVFTMTISVGFLEIGELGHRMDRSLYKTQRLFIRTVCIKITYAGELGRIILNVVLICRAGTGF